MYQCAQTREQQIATWCAKGKAAVGTQLDEVHTTRISDALRSSGAAGSIIVKYGVCKEG